jgi:hypothetical protein
LILDISHERFDGGQPDVPRHGSVFALGLDVLQKCDDQGGVDLLQVQLRWILTQSRGGVLKQQAERVRVGVAGMFARATINGSRSRRNAVI